MNKFICSCFIFGYFLFALSPSLFAQGNFDSFLGAANEKRFISDSYKVQHLSPVSSSDWIQEYDFHSLYFYAKGAHRLHGDIYIQFSVNPPDAICAGSLIVRFSEEGKLLEHELIEVNCQQDEESEFFVNSEYGFVNDSVIEVQYKRWENVDLTFMNEQRGYSYLILGKEKMISVNLGPPEEFAPQEDMLSYKLLKETELMGKSKAELRVLRNSLFAKHGYVFRSKDLAEHFETQSWYQKSEKSQAEILEEMNALEKINIQIIQRLEKAKK